MTNHRVTPFSLSRAFSSSYTNSSGTHQEQTILPTVAVKATSTFDGVDNPRWRDQVRLGINATTACSGTHFTGLPIYIDIRCYAEYATIATPHSRTWQSAEVLGYMVPALFPASPSVSASVVTDATNRCIRKFLQEVNEAQTNGNLTGRSIKHFEHDIHSAFNPLSAVRGKISEYLEQITKSASKYKRGSPFLINAIRDSYLEFEFGLRPFSEDMRSILGDLSRRRFPTQRVSGSSDIRYDGQASSTLLTSSAIGLVSNFGFASIHQPYKSVSHYGVRYIGAVRTKVNPDSGKVGWFQDNNLLPKDWLPTLFHILPYSWMVDYFTNIGDVIDSLSFVFADLVYACKTTVTETSVTIDPNQISVNWSPVPAGCYWITQQADVSGGSSTWSAKKFTRSELVPTDLVPQLVFRIPTRPLQYVNMLAAFLPRINQVVSLLM